MRAGQIVVVRYSERIPVDGIVSDGEALVDEAHITGRSEPSVRRPGDRVYAGAIIAHGMLHIRARRVGSDTYMARIAKRVEDALANRSQAETEADLLANRLTVYGIVSTIATAIVTRSWSRTLSVQLAMASPCATVLAASTAVTAALANAARNGAIIKGGLYLERFGSVDCFCFDKTGTVTEKAPTLAEIVPARPQADPVEVLTLAADAQAHNPHPLARALIAAAASHGHQPRIPAQSDLVLGHGVKAVVDDHRIVVGNRSLMDDEGIDVTVFDNTDRRLTGLGYTCVYVAKDGSPEGLIGIAYEVQPRLDYLLDHLRADGVREIHLISGDATEVVRKVAQDHGFDGYGGDMLPEQKAEYVEKLNIAGRTVAMVGDGINDAPALAKARIGVALGAGGAEAAIEAADIALVDNDLIRLVHMRELSRRTLQVVEQNHWFAIASDVLGAMLGMAGYFSPLMSGFAHSLHTVVISLNSSRLLAWKPDGLEETDDSPHLRTLEGDDLALRRAATGGRNRPV